MGQKITDLEALSVADNGDYFEIVDTSENTSKKITAANAIPASAVTTAKIANNAVVQLRLNATESTDFANPISLTANTWVDLKGNQNFDVASTSSIIKVSINAAVGVGNSTAGVIVSSRVVIDSAGTPNNKILGVTMITNSAQYQYARFGEVYLTGLSAGTHTIKTQLRTVATTLSAYCRPSTVPDTEFFNTTVVEYKK